jgi:hypothetical protein
MLYTWNNPTKLYELLTIIHMYRVILISIFVPILIMHYYNYILVRKIIKDKTQITWVLKIEYFKSSVRLSQNLQPASSRMRVQHKWHVGCRQRKKIFCDGAAPHGSCDMNTTWQAGPTNTRSRGRNNLHHGYVETIRTVSHRAACCSTVAEFFFSVDNSPTNTMSKNHFPCQIRFASSVRLSQNSRPATSRMCVQHKWHPVRRQLAKCQHIFYEHDPLSLPNQICNQETHPVSMICIASWKVKKATAQLNQIIIHVTLASV